MAGRALKSIGKDAHLWRPDFQVSSFKDIQAPFENGSALRRPPWGRKTGRRTLQPDVFPFSGFYRLENRRNHLPQKISGKHRPIRFNIKKHKIRQSGHNFLHVRRNRKTKKPFPVKKTEKFFQRKQKIKIHQKN